MSKKILMVTTNCFEINDKIKTGVTFEEFAVPFLVFVATGYSVTVASPNGGVSTIDENSLSCSNPMEWDETAKYLKDTKKLSNVDACDFDALFIVGGHGTMFDLYDNQVLNCIISKMYSSNKIIAAICHGVVALISVFDDCGQSILKNKYITAFTNLEECILKMEEFMPFSLEDKIKELGASFVAQKPWSEHTEISCNIVTAQNQQSSLLAAEAVISLL